MLHRYYLGRFEIYSLNAGSKLNDPHREVSLVVFKYFNVKINVEINCYIINFNNSQDEITVQREILVNAFSLLSTRGYR